MTNPTPSTSETELRVRVEKGLAPGYEIQDEIGRGGAGIVYRARDTRLKREVAIKLLPPDLAFRSDVRERFMREAETSARLNHPNIVQIYSVDEKDGLAYFVMALIEGQNL
ncbi:MAG: protein kinase, partial [Gemmatimonadaceae bacterium]